MNSTERLEASKETITLNRTLQAEFVKLKLANNNDKLSIEQKDNIRANFLLLEADTKSQIKKLKKKFAF